MKLFITTNKRRVHIKTKIITEYWEKDGRQEITRARCRNFKDGNEHCSDHEKRRWYHYNSENIGVSY